ncbi:hypothetical protein V6N12_013845 [Hibiscus sabdariffa]|uniref:Cellulose synthase n=1 Tax=Hibiscus sabdariffa TaxID=183260 RepID=A0ABR2A050_9ROSI
MLEQGVFSEGKHFMVLTPQFPRSLLARPAIVRRSGAATFDDVLERTRRSKRKRKRSLRKGKLQSRYMLLKTLKRQFHVKELNSQPSMTSQMKLEKKFGQSPVFVASTLLEDGGVPHNGSPASLLREVIQVIISSYEDKTEWGKEVGWIYGSVTEDILTGFKMQCHGWRSVYCIPKRPAFKGSTPINLSYRLHLVLRWALKSVEIFLSKHCPIWYGYGGGLKWLEQFSYINSVVYPWTSIPLLVYCTLPTICLLTGKFIVPEISNYASLVFMALFISIAATGILEMHWDGVGLQKLLADVNTSFTVTSKVVDDGEFSKLYLFKWTSLLIPPTTLLIINIFGIVVGISDAINNGYDSWGLLFGAIFFAIWVIIHLYPFLKGLLRKQDRMPTII